MKRIPSSVANFSKSFFLLIAVFIGLGLLFNFLSNREPKPETWTQNELVQAIEEKRVVKLTVEPERILVEANDKKKAVVHKEADTSAQELLTVYGVKADVLKTLPIEVQGATGALFWFRAVVVPFLGPLILLFVILFIMARQLRGMNNRALSFGQSTARQVDRNKKQATTFKDVAGTVEAKAELEEMVESLNNPKKFAALGANIPKGVLLMGPPGCGKTLLAKAVAGEADVPFFHMSGSEFVEMFVGVGASRVRDLFHKAKKHAPAIVFVDELDAVGRQRGAGLGGSHDEREQTLNQILVEMDGFDPHVGLIVLGATNRPDILDPALLRPGRFDRRVMITLPDLKEREDILKVHSAKKPLAPEVNLRTIAERTPGSSGADLANLLNEAAILAARRNLKHITQKELTESVEKVLLGPERKSRIVSEKERKVIAFHEAGHALVAHNLPHTDPVHKISIISRGQAGGYTMKVPTEDRSLASKDEMFENIATMLGGYAAEQAVFGELTTGASDDLKKATEIARKMITRYGMSETLGPRTYGESEELVFLGKQISEQRDYSEKVAEQIDTEVSKLMSDALKTAQGLIQKFRDTLDTIAKTLLEKETLEREDFLKLLPTA